MSNNKIILFADDVFLQGNPRGQERMNADLRKWISHFTQNADASIISRYSHKDIQSWLICSFVVQLFHAIYGRNHGNRERLYHSIKERYTDNCALVAYHPEDIEEARACGIHDIYVTQNSPYLLQEHQIDPRKIIPSFY